jgi:hypothetical protein
MAGVFPEDLNIVERQFDNVAIEAATTDLIVLLLPVSQVSCVLICIIRFHYYGLGALFWCEIDVV